MAKANKKDHLPLENLDINSNTEKPDECLLYDLIDIALKSGRTIFFGISYSVLPSEVCCSDFVVKNHYRFQLFLRFLHIFFFLFLSIPFVTERITLSTCCLINLIKKGLHVVLLSCMVVGYYCLEIKIRKGVGGITGIFRQCVLLQNKFKSLGVHFPARTKIRALGWGVCLTSCLICLVRQYMFATKHSPWYLRYARGFSKTASLGFWTPSNETTETTQIILGFLGIWTDCLIFNFWSFVQILHMSFVVTMWMIFDKFNGGMKSGLLETRHMPEVVDLHFQSTKLLKLINQLVSPLTFLSIVFDIICMCFWTNYIALDRNIRLIYIAALCFFLKTAVCLILVADVNSKAHEISEWLEESCASSEKVPAMNLMKFTVFTAQIYNKDTTGFRGLNFFVVTPHLVLAVAGIVVTYTVAVNQFCHINDSHRS